MVISYIIIIIYNIYRIFIISHNIGVCVVCSSAGLTIFNHWRFPLSSHGLELSAACGRLRQRQGAFSTSLRPVCVCVRIFSSSCSQDLIRAYFGVCVRVVHEFWITIRFHLEYGHVQLWVMGEEPPGTRKTVEHWIRRRQPRVLSVATAATQLSG